jgi:hypothetical protein
VTRAVESEGVNRVSIDEKPPRPETAPDNWNSLTLYAVCKRLHRSLKYGTSGTARTEEGHTLDFESVPSIPDLLEEARQIRKYH